jgi:hypothetical protein
MSEARTADRLDHLERDVGEIKTILADLRPLIVGIHAQLLATKTELADLRTELKGDLRGLRTELARKPGHGHAWVVMAALISSYTLALAGAAVIFAWLQAQPRLPWPSRASAASLVLAAETRPFDWDRYHARQDACLEADRIAQDCTGGVAYRRAGIAPSQARLLGLWAGLHTRAVTKS